jgi:hypothetical protein
MADSDQLAKRDAREFMSKSFLTTAELCGQKAWFDIHRKKPFPVVERVVFGKAVDAGVQVVIAGVNAGHASDDISELVDATIFKVLEDEERRAENAGIDPGPIEQVVVDDVRTAVLQFQFEVLRQFDFAFASTQHEIRLELEGVGMIDAHPDIILRDNSIFDVKTASRAKASTAASGSVRELGFYAVAREREVGRLVPTVGYITWVRSTRPYWQIVTATVTDELRRASLAVAQMTKRALIADERMNADAVKPENWSFASGPAFSGLCSDCQHRVECPIYEGDTSRA